MEKREIETAKIKLAKMEADAQQKRKEKEKQIMADIEAGAGEKCIKKSKTPNMTNSSCKIKPKIYGLNTCQSQKLPILKWKYFLLNPSLYFIATLSHNPESDKLQNLGKLEGEGLSRRAPNLTNAEIARILLHQVNLFRDKTFAQKVSRKRGRSRKAAYGVSWVENGPSRISSKLLLNESTWKTEQQIFLRQNFFSPL